MAVRTDEVDTQLTFAGSPLYLFSNDTLVRMVWGDGLLNNLGELDFAGGTVIHINAELNMEHRTLNTGHRTPDNEHHPRHPRDTLYISPRM